MIILSRSLKRLCTISMATLIFFFPCFGNLPKTEAASLTQTLLFSSVAYAYINGQLNNLNENHQADLLKQTQQSTGVYENDEQNAYLDKVARRLMSNGLIKHHYAVYLTPDKKFNAFCTLGRVIAVNRGAIETLDEDEFATVLGHEMGHGEHRDPVEGTRKILGIGLVVDLYLQNNPSLTTNLLGTAATNYVANEVITMQEEWNADNAGFDNAVAAGYNPGGGAAAMAKMRAKLGELWHEGLSKIIAPNNHPKTSDRVNNFAKRLTDYSNGHITVKNDKTVQIDGKDVITPVKNDTYMAEERAYLIAGNLARVYHNNAIGTASVGDDGGIYIGEQLILLPADGDDDSHDLADKINAATGR